MTSGGTRNFFVGASRGKNAILRGQKSKNLPKMADFGHFFLLTGGASGGGQSLQLGAFAPCPPLDAATDCKSGFPGRPVQCIAMYYNVMY